MKIHTLLVILASAVTVSTIIILSFLAKDITLFEDYISDLGVSEYAIIFNPALMTAGILVMPFALRIYKKDRYLSLLIFASAAALAGVGIFTEASELHGPISGAFFLLSLIAMPYAGVKDKSNFGKLSVALSAIGLIGLIFINPLIEALEVFLIAAWLAFFAYRNDKLY